MEERKLSVEIAKAIGTPIDPNLPVNPMILAIAETDAVPAGEDCWTFVADTEVDKVYTLDSNGAITVVKVVPNATSALNFAYFDSGLHYILAKDVLETKDSSKLARTKARVTRGLDKKEVAGILTVALAAATGTRAITQATAEDILDVIIRMKQSVEDYGDNYILLAGSAVKAKIDAYDKDRADQDYYKVGINETLAGMGIKVIKVSGKLTVDSGSDTALLATDSAILVALDSTLQVGRPFVAVRRIISPELAAGMGIEVTEAQRGLFVANTPVILSGVNTLGYGIYGFENFVIACINPLAVAKCVTIS
jgi:hypothetical protein